MGCKIKICGLTRPEDCDFVNAAAPDFAGFVFAPSRRRVSAETAADLRERLDARIKTVGVFVNESVEAISALFEAGIIDMAQLHGDESDEFVKNLRDALCGGGGGGGAEQDNWGNHVASGAQGCANNSVPLIIKSVSVGGVLPALPNEPDFLLFDTLSDMRGGSGVTFNWELLQDFNERSYFLSGGLTGANVVDALGILSPYCVDVSSGVETDGKKDAGKIKQFTQAVREFRGGND